jgi:CheY-like chemotaxis protein
MTEKSNKKIILIVEDDPFVRDIYQTKIAEKEYEAVVAINGAEAMKKLESGFLPDLILLDIIMPYMDGLQFLEKIKADEKFSKVPVILLTNLGQKDEIKKGISMGAQDYLIKSHFTPSEVMEKIDQYLK